MADLEIKPDFAFQKRTVYDTIITEFENGVEQRRPRRAQSVRKWFLQFRNRPLSEITTIQNIFDACKGRFSTFTWLHPLDGQTYTVRFEDDTLDPINHLYGFYDLEFSVTEVL